ncbi:TPA: hypothetical protein HA241_00990 [Candidatus Woesearchaeota archaeon]|nr:hypothetical protein [Candidatus Woesearchaeota archaeon]
MRLQHLLLSALLGTTATITGSIDDYVYATPQEKVPRFNPVITASINPDYKQGLKDDAKGKEKLYVDGIVTLDYSGTETIKSPLRVTYSVCFGPPAEDEDVAWGCVAGGPLGTIDSLVVGATLHFDLHAKTFNSTASLKKDNGDRPMRDLTPHITVTINDSSGVDIYREDILLRPIGDYK